MASVPGNGRHRGRLTEWNDERGFGFVTSLDGESRAFVHVSAFPHSLRRPKLLDLLTYELRKDERGRLQAANVEFMAHVETRRAAAHHVDASEAASAEIPVWVPLGFLLAVLMVVLLRHGIVASALLGGYAVMSGITFWAYAADKAAAQAGKWRTEESALHLMEVVGGWPGALLAQRRFRHKTRKVSYQIVFWICVVVNLGAVLGIALTLPPWSV